MFHDETKSNVIGGVHTKKTRNIKIVVPELTSVVDPKYIALYYYCCPECGCGLYEMWKYCPCCGSQLRWEMSAETNAIKRLIKKIRKRFE